MGDKITSVDILKFYATFRKIVQQLGWKKASELLAKIVLAAQLEEPDA